MQDSIFTKIIKGEVPCHKVYEDEKTLAFLDIHPIHEGHTLVVPKAQVEFVWDLDASDYASLMATAKKVALQLRETLPYPFIGERIIGIDVPHAHLHLIPFTTATELNAVQDMTSQPDHTVLADLAKKLYFS